MGAPQVFLSAFARHNCSWIGAPRYFWQDVVINENTSVVSIGVLSPAIDPALCILQLRNHSLLRIQSLFHWNIHYFYNWFSILSDWLLVFSWIHLVLWTQSGRWRTWQSYYTNPSAGRRHQHRTCCFSVNTAKLSSDHDSFFFYVCLLKCSSKSSPPYGKQPALNGGFLFSWQAALPLASF